MHKDIAHRFSERKLLSVGLLIFVLILAIFVAHAQTRTSEKTFKGIPIPFLSNDISLQSEISNYGTQNGIPIRQVTFQRGVESYEFLQEDEMYLVHIPDSDLVQEKPLNDLMTNLVGENGHSVDFFGYLYSDDVASAEIANRFADEFAERYPNDFFTSYAACQNAFDRNDPLEYFEETRNVVFYPTNGPFENVNMRKGSLWLIVANETVRFAPLISPLCGNTVVDIAEDCDDGSNNGATGSLCNEQCLWKIPVPPFGESSSSSADSSSSQGVSSSSSSSSSSGPGGTPSSSSSSSQGQSTSSSSSQGTSSSGPGGAPSSSSSSSGPGTFPSSSSSSSSGPGTFPSSSSSSSSSGPGGTPSSSSSSSGPGTFPSSSSSSAAPFCGDGVRQGAEECDDGDADNSDTCTDACEFAACGDGYFQPDGADGTPGTLDDEECDDGNTVNNDSCSNSCELIDNPF